MGLIMRFVCVLKTTVLVLFVIFTLSAAVRRKLGLSIAQGLFPSSSLALGQSAQVRRRGALPERGALLALFL